MSPLCETFPKTLAGPALAWMLRLPRGSIGSFWQLTESFATYFGASRRRRKGIHEMLNFKQRENENLASYIKRFTNEMVHDYDDKFARCAFMEEMVYSEFNVSVRKANFTFYAHLIDAATQYIRAEEWAREGVQAESSKNPNKQKGEAKRESGGWETRRSRHRERNRPPGEAPTRRPRRRR
ncbi:LOW QUALITY PROTEIN: hypothetical protein V2J09_016719 [Rumex salicifolius]